MHTVQSLRHKWEEGRFGQPLLQLYGSREAPLQERRYGEMLDRFAELFPGREATGFYSAPGRAEIGGNHTDHQQGKVLAAAVNLDMVCAACPAGDKVIRLQCEGYAPIAVDLRDLSPRPEEKGTPAGLVRGMAAAFRRLGYSVGGLWGYLHSQVLPGSGLSSSAAFTVTVGTVLSHLFNGGAVDAVTVALAAQEAENIYFGKPSGLMDQLACSIGGFAMMDFADPGRPSVTRVPFDLEATGYALCIVDSGGSHADLTRHYAAIPGEMNRVARQLGQPVLSKTDPADFLERLPELREKSGDRALLRSLHFYRENARVPQMAAALEAGDFSRFLELVDLSGRSSWMYLQNVQLPRTLEQELPLALALSDLLLEGKGACRVQGGGFAGTIQAYVPRSRLPDYRAYMERVFGDGCCREVQVRQAGGTAVEP